MTWDRSSLLAMVYGLVVLAAAADVAWLAPQLPERVASKFGAGGQPVAWCDRGSFLTWHIFGLAFTAALFPGIRLAITTLPATWINLPHRDYWLAPEREETTRRLLGNLLLALGTGLLVLLAAIGHGVMRANLTPEPRLDHTFTLLGLLGLGGIVAFLIQWYRLFRRPR